MEGDNFGLNKNYKYYEIQLDSLDCIESAEGGFLKTDFPLFKLVTPIPNIAAVKVLEVQIPFSWYVINAGNNTFVVADGLSTRTVTIPIGNYSATSLATQLGTSLGVGYTVTASTQASTPNTGKFSIAGGGPFTLTFGAADDLGVTNPRLILGFPAGVTSSGVGSTIIAPYCYQVTGPDYIYLNSRSFGTTITSVLPGGAASLGKGSIGPQITKIPVTVQPGGVLYWQDPAPLYWMAFENLPLLTQFDLYLTLGNNALGTVLNLNGLSFSVKLGLLQFSNENVQTQGPSGFFPASTIMQGKKRVKY
jgi:hypothetical protein